MTSNTNGFRSKRRSSFLCFSGSCIPINAKLSYMDVYIVSAVELNLPEGGSLDEREAVKS